MDLMPRCRRTARLFRGTERFAMPQRTIRKSLRRAQPFPRHKFSGGADPCMRFASVRYAPIGWLARARSRIAAKAGIGHRDSVLSPVEAEQLRRSGHEGRLEQRETYRAVC